MVFQEFVNHDVSKCDVIVHPIDFDIAENVIKSKTFVNCENVESELEIGREKQVSETESKGKVIQPLMEPEFRRSTRIKKPRILFGV